MRREHHLLSPIPAVQLVMVEGGRMWEMMGGACMLGGGRGALLLFLLKCVLVLKAPNQQLTCGGRGGLVAWCWMAC